MSQAPPDFFDRSSEPLGQRIAQGLSKIGLALRHQARQDAGESGLSPTQSQILAIIADGPRRPSEVAAQMRASSRRRVGIETIEAVLLRGRRRGVLIEPSDAERLLRAA